jgi:hypothetical protein
MTVRPLSLAALLLAVALSAAPAFARPSAAASPCAVGTVTTTASYQLALELGPRQEMYLPSEVRARKLKTGQVMLGGEMVMMDSPPAGTKIFDLAVHICTKSGAVVTTLKPKIAVRSAGRAATALPVAMMAGVAEGLRDYHYGNDVALKPGSSLTVTVTVNGQRAVFRNVAVPKR